MIRWVFSVVHSSAAEELVKLMDGRAAEGWTLANIVQQSGTFYAFFQRQTDFPGGPTATGRAPTAR